MTGKQRSKLKKMAQHMKPHLTMGKNGLSEAFIKEVENELELYELIKINVLPNSDEDPKEFARSFVDSLGAEFVSQLGHKLVIYRESQTLPRNERIIL